MQVFEEAMALPSEERAGFVARRVPDDPAVREEVGALLQHAESQAGDVGTGVGLRELQVETPDHGGLALDVSPGETLPALRGAYRIIRTIGEGGMGVVYEAQQSYPRRRVALKALRAGHATRGMIARFQREVQLLARLQHPGIAAIYEAGVADEESPGQAFFAMEYVDGSALNVYLTEQRPSVRTIIELMIRVCDAVQHAHQRGVIHRDLKPANILVTKIGEPKVVDFGIARASEDFGEGTLVRTHDGQLIGTPAYMSPEQLRGLEVDTRSDVYSLGVVTFEAISGKPPFATANKPLAAVIELVCNASTPHVEVPDIRIASDLKTVVAKAMATDPSRRYASAAEFSGDLRRVLTGEAVIARRDSIIYIMRKAVARHRAAAVGLVTTLLALILFTVYAAVSAATQRQLAQQAKVAQSQAESSLNDANAAADRAFRAEQTAYNAAEQAIDELALNTIERGRAEAALGNISLAEELLWKANSQGRLNNHSHWALWELYCNSGSIRRWNLPRFARIVSETQDSVLTLLLARNIMWTQSGWDSAEGTSVAGPPGTFGAIVAMHGSERAIVSLRSGELYYVSLRCEIGPAYWPILNEVLPAQSSSLADISGDGRWLVIVGTERILRVIDLTKNVVTSAVPMSRPIAAVAFNYDGSVIAAGPEDYLAGDIELYSHDTRGVELLHRLNKVSESSLRCLVFARNGASLLCGSRAGTLTSVNLTSAIPTSGRPQRMGGVVYSIVQSKDGDKFVVSAGDRVYICSADASIVQPLGRTLVENPMADWVGNDRIRVVGNDASLRLYDPITRPWIKRYPGLESWCFSVEYSLGGDRLYLGSGDSTLRVCNTQTGESRVLHTLPQSRMRTRAIVAMKDDRRIIAASQDGIVRILDSRTGEVLQAFASGRSELFALALSPDERTLAVGSSDRYVRIHNLETCDQVAVSERFDKRVEGLAYSPDSRWIAVSGDMGSVSLLDAQEYYVAKSLALASPPWALKFTDDAQSLVVTTRDGTLASFDVTSGATIFLERAHQRLAPGLDISHDGTLLATGAEDGLVRIWDAKTGKNLVSLAPELSTVVQVKFSPGDKRLAIGAAFFEACEYDFEMVRDQMLSHAPQTAPSTVK